MARSREELEARLAELRAEQATRLTDREARLSRQIFSYELPFEARVRAMNDNQPDNVIHVAFGIDPRRAYDLYSQASAIDEDVDRLEEAEALYREAIRRDPTLAIAYTNLGNIRWRRSDEHEAMALYREAIAIDDRQPEAHYNLGYVLLERGDIRGGIEELERTIALDPKFADAIFNLAMAYEQLRERATARPLWRRYLELEPEGEWAAIAARHLEGNQQRPRRRRRS